MERTDRDAWWHEEPATPNAAPPPPDSPTDPETPYLLIYTSGTTGRPKAAVHVHGGFPIKGAQDLAHHFDLRSGDTLFWFTDLGWMMGPWAISGALLLGARLVLYEGAPDYPGPDRLWSIVERHKVTHLGLSPTVIRALMAHGEEPVRSHDLGSLRVLGSTGEPWNPEPWWWYFREVGGGRCPIVNYSGGTEVSGGIVSGNLLTPIKPTAFSGPCIGTAADVVDDAGRPLRDAVGELVIRAPLPGMTRGFWRDPERYEETYWSRFPGMWVHGDWARIDPDGHWFILGRSDDTLKIAGKRVGPAEVESAAVGHPAVLEAAAIGVPHEIKGEAVVVMAVLRPGTSDDDGLRADIGARIAAELGKPLRPETVEVVTALPKTRSGKVMRRVIRAAYLGLDPGDLSSLDDPASVHGDRTAGAPARRLEVAHDERRSGRERADIVSWENLDGLVADLASRLTGEFDLLLAITRGGLVPAGMLAYRLRDPEHPRRGRRLLRRRGPARPAPDVPAVPRRPAAARPAGADRRRGVGQRHDDPRRDGARAAGRRHPDDRRPSLQA